MYIDGIGIFGILIACLINVLMCWRLYLSCTGRLDVGYTDGEIQNLYNWGLNENRTYSGRERSSSDPVRYVFNSPSLKRDTNYQMIEIINDDSGESTIYENGLPTTVPRSMNVNSKDIMSDDSDMVFTPKYIWDTVGGVIASSWEPAMEENREISQDHLFLSSDSMDNLL